MRYEELDMEDILHNLKALHDKDPARFRKLFPDYKEKYMLHWGIFLGSANNEDDLLKLKARVENRLACRTKCAVSIYYRQHVITGCFDTEVVYNHHAYLNNAFYYFFSDRCFTSVCETGEKIVFC